MRANVDAWTHEIDLDQAADNVDAIIVNASGCGTMVKDYAFILRNDKAYAEKSRRISELTRDVSEFVSEMDVLPNSDRGGLRVTYHSACSLQHGQEITATPQKLLTTLGFNVSEPDEAHLCCGSAGTYNLMQPEIASQLRDRKVAHISRTLPDVIATGNIGCMIQIQDAVEVPVLHTVELLDWGTGGPRPEGLSLVKSFLHWIATAATLTFSVPMQASQNDARLPMLFEKLKSAETLEEALPIEKLIWNIWLMSGNGELDALILKGLQAMGRESNEEALAAFSKVTEVQPDFAEAWNKRATVNYLLGRYQDSVIDIQKTLSLEPRHFGALSGLGLINLAIGHEREALKAFEAALKIHPHLPGAKTYIEELRKTVHGKQV